jgi:hypothetical protein
MLSVAPTGDLQSWRIKDNLSRLRIAQRHPKPSMRTSLRMDTKMSSEMLPPSMLVLRYFLFSTTGFYACKLAYRHTASAAYKRLFLMLLKRHRSANTQKEG